MRCVLLAGLLIAMAATPSAAQTEAPRLFEPGLVSTGFDDSHVSFSPDGQTMYFLRNSPDFAHWTILESHRRHGRWAPPRLASINSGWSDADVFVARDGQSLFFVSNRPIEGRVHEDTDIWTARRIEGGWSTPERVPQLSSEGYEWFPTMTDGGVVYFGSERAGGAGRSDLWRARWLGDHFSEPENLGPNFNSSEQEIEPLIAPDESWLIFAARRPEGAGSYDLFVSYNCPAGWTRPAPLTGVNTAAWEFAPRLSPDGRSFLFTSNRATTGGAFENVRSVQDLEHRLHAPGNGLRDVYEVDFESIGVERRCPG